jgi:ABC-type antimicrobial peptide transport system permease subunit
MRGIRRALALTFFSGILGTTFGVALGFFLFPSSFRRRRPRGGSSKRPYVDR